MRIAALLVAVIAASCADKSGSGGAPLGSNSKSGRWPGGTPNSPGRSLPLTGYFVDSVGGSDTSNPCTVQATPCKTIARLVAVAPPAGSFVYLKRGSTFREMIHVSGSGPSGGLANGIKILAYGTGVRPIVDGADIIPAGSWTKTGGRANVYQATVSSSGIYGVAGMGNRIWEDGTKLTYVADVATVDATAGSWTGPTRPSGTASDTFYVHASDASNPASSGKVYEWPARPYCVHGGQYSTDANHFPVIAGIHAKRHGHHDGGIISASTVNDFVVDPGGAGPVDPSHGLWCNGYCSNGTTSSIISYGNNMPAVSVVNVTVNCSSPVGNPPTNNGTGIYFHTGTIGGSKHAKMTYRNITGTNCNQLFGGDAATQVAIIRAYATDNTIKYFASYSNVDRLDIVGAQWVRHDLSADTNGILLSTVPLATIYGGRFVTNRAAPYGLISADTSSNTVLTITGNSFVFTAGPPSMSAAYRGSVANRTTGGTITMTRNFIHYGGRPIYLPNSTSVSSDYNVVNTGAASWDVNGTTYANWAAWQATGQDAHSVQETSTMEGDPTTGDTEPTSASAAWTVPAGADAYGDANMDAYIATIP